MKIATWNVCLGLTTKKEIVSRTIVEEDIDICCIQEAEIPVGFPINELTSKIIQSKLKRTLSSKEFAFTFRQELITREEKIWRTRTIIL